MVIRIFQGLSRVLFLSGLGLAAEKLVGWLTDSISDALGGDTLEESVLSAQTTAAGIYGAFGHTGAQVLWNRGVISFEMYSRVCLIHAAIRATPSITATYDEDVFMSAEAQGKILNVVAAANVYSYGASSQPARSGSVRSLSPSVSAGRDAEIDPAALNQRLATALGYLHRSAEVENNLDLNRQSVIVQAELSHSSARPGDAAAAHAMATQVHAIAAQWARAAMVEPDQLTEQILASIIQSIIASR